MKRRTLRARSRGVMPGKLRDEAIRILEEAAENAERGKGRVKANRLLKRARKA
jgi:hypothetical protein